MSSIQLMTHVVAGYRSFLETEKIMEIMSMHKVSYIEVQIPFSDPIGDGPTITMANQYVLDRNVSVDDVFNFIAYMSKKISTPIIVMTYLNIAYNMGFKNFFSRVKSSGAKAVILPDLSFNTSKDKEIEDAFEYAHSMNIPIIPVISPNTTKNKMSIIANRMKQKNNTYMVYCTQRTGVTGTHQSNLNIDNTSYLQMAKDIFSCPLAGGFGISSATQIKALKGIVDIAVIGSHIINLYKDTPIYHNQDTEIPSSSINTSSEKTTEGIEKVKRFFEEISHI